MFRYVRTINFWRAVQGTSLQQTLQTTLTSDTCEQIIPDSQCRLNGAQRGKICVCGVVSGPYFLIRKVIHYLHLSEGSYSFVRVLGALLIDYIMKDDH